MKLTPLDIKKQEFTRTFRGIDPQEVQGFLDMVADQWSGLLDENRRLEQNIRDMDAKLIHYRKIEEALQEALETARDNSHKTIENAQREAQIILKEARAEAEEIRGKAYNEHKRLKSDVTKIAGRRDEITARLRAFLMSELEILARFEGQDPIGFIRLSTAEKRKLERPNAASLEAYHDEPDADEEAAYPTNEGRIDTSFDAEPKPPARPAPSPAPAHQPPVVQPIPQPAAPSVVQTTQPAPATPPPPPSIFAQRPPVAAAPPPPPAPFFEPEPEPEREDMGGLSSDDLDFIKATVTTAAHPVDVDGFFKPAEPMEEEPWMSGDDEIETYDDEEATSQTIDLGPVTPRPAPSPFDPPARETGHWVRNPIVSREPAEEEVHGDSIPDAFEKPLFGGQDDHDDLTATPEEIEKIRRILNDLD